jgi:thymidylate synthase ThyX
MGTSDTNMGGIYAKIVADSIANNVRLTTLALHYPRFILPEVNTHRIFSRSTSSSRAIPTSKLIEQVETVPAMPVYWGENKSGMQADKVCEKVEEAKICWVAASKKAAHWAKILAEYKVHKQVTNRVLEPYLFVNTVVTATEWDNFFRLRLDAAAQPEFRALAWAMKIAMDNSTPTNLVLGEWHLPFTEGLNENIETMQLVSAARCARVSYLNHDGSKSTVAKDVQLANQLLADRHMSPLEHQASPMEYVCGQGHHKLQWEKGITHVDREDNFWSGNLRGWVQFRQLKQYGF